MTELEQRFPAQYRAVAEDEPGLVLGDDGLVYVVGLDGSRTQVVGGGGGGGGIQFDQSNVGGSLSVQTSDACQVEAGAALDLRGTIATLESPSGGQSLELGLEGAGAGYGVVLANDDLVNNSGIRIINNAGAAHGPGGGINIENFSFGTDPLLIRNNAEPGSSLLIHNETTGAGDGIDIENTGGGGFGVKIGDLASWIRITNAAGIQMTGNPGFYGKAPVPQAAHPVTLADVINLLTNLGLCAA